MPKQSVAVYMEPALRNRLEKAKSAREKLIPPGVKSISSYAAYLIAEGLNVEEKKLKKLEADANRLATT